MRKPRYLHRITNTRESVPRILIVCEGEKTEVNYFNGFRLPSVQVRVHGAGANTRSLVDRAREIADEDGDFDEVWCVFDRDAFPLNDFNAAFQLAAEHGFQVAYSNQSFELWFCLHYHYYHSALTRQDYVDKLSQLLGTKYEKADRGMYQRLIVRQATAIQYANRLLASHGASGPAAADPSTTVHRLVERLNQIVTLLRGGV